MGHIEDALSHLHSAVAHANRAAMVVTPIEQAIDSAIGATSVVQESMGNARLDVARALDPDSGAAQRLHAAATAVEELRARISIALHELSNAQRDLGPAVLGYAGTLDQVIANISSAGA